MGTAEATETEALAESRRGIKIEDPPGGTQEDGAGGKYFVRGTDMEEIAANSAYCIGEETEDSESEEGAKTADGVGQVGRMLTPTEERT